MKITITSTEPTRFRAAFEGAQVRTRDTQHVKLEKPAILLGRGTDADEKI